MSAPAGPPGAEPVRATVWAHASVLLYHWRLVVGIPVLAALAVGVYSLALPRKYKASASFVAEDAPVAQGSLSLVASQLGIGTRSGATSPLFYADLLQSRGITHAVVLTTFSVERPFPRQGTLVRLFRIDDSDSARAVARSVKRLQEAMSVRTDRNTGVVYLDVTSTSPDLSVQIVQRFLSLVSDFNLRRRQSRAHSEREFIQQRLTDARAELNSAESTLRLFYERNRRFNDSPELVLQEASMQRQVSLRQQLYVMLSQSYAAAEIEEVRNTPVISLVDSPVGSAERQPRGTVIRTLGVFSLFLLLSVAAAYLREYVRLSRSSSADYARYRAALEQMRRSLASTVRWRGPRPPAQRQT